MAAHIDVDLITHLESKLLHIVWIIEIPNVRSFLACGTEHGPFIRLSLSVDSRTEGPARRGGRDTTIELEVTVAPLQGTIMCDNPLPLYRIPWASRLRRAWSARACDARRGAVNVK